MAVMDAQLLQRFEDVVRSDQARPVAYAMAVAISSLQVKVTSSHSLGPLFCVDANLRQVVHRQCSHTKTHVTSDVTEVLNLGDTRLQYDYEFGNFRAASAGQVRVVAKNHRYTKPVPTSGTYAFRSDSLISHLSMMKGYLPGLDGGFLPPGRASSSAGTDATIQAGVYAYGSLEQCPRSGPGKWSIQSSAVVSEALRSILNASVITVLQGVSPRAGPTSKNLGQWAKCGFHPSDVRVVGCIVPQEFEEMLSSMQMGRTTTRQYHEALLRPQLLLSPECRMFLTRFAIGGNWLAYCEDLLFRVILKQDQWQPKSASIGKAGIAEMAIRQAELWLRESSSFSIPCGPRDKLRQWLLQDSPHFIIGGSVDGKRITATPSLDDWDSISQSDFDNSKAVVTIELLRYLQSCHEVVRSAAVGLGLELWEVKSWCTCSSGGECFPTVGSLEFDQIYSSSRRIHDLRPPLVRKRPLQLSDHSSSKAPRTSVGFDGASKAQSLVGAPTAGGSSGSGRSAVVLLPSPIGVDDRPPLQRDVFVAITEITWDVLMTPYDIQADGTCLSFHQKLDLGCPRSQRSLGEFKNKHTSRMMCFMDRLRLNGVDLRCIEVIVDLGVRLLTGRNQWGWYVTTSPGSYSKHHRTLHPICRSWSGDVLVNQILSRIRQRRHALLSVQNPV